MKVLAFIITLAFGCLSIPPCQGFISKDEFLQYKYKNFSAEQIDPVLSEQFYRLSAEDMHGNTVSFDQFRGKVILITSADFASRYADYNLDELIRFQDLIGVVFPDHFKLLLFPSSQLTSGKDRDLEGSLWEYAEERGIPLNVMKTCDVIGKHGHPVFQNLIKQTNHTPDTNFWKYLVDHQGRVRYVWSPDHDVIHIGYQVRYAAIEATGQPDDYIPLPPDILEIQRQREEESRNHTRKQTQPTVKCSPTSLVNHSLEDVCVQKQADFHN